MHFSRDQGIPSKGPGIIWHGGTQPPDEVIASSGVTFQLWRLYQHAWLVCLLFPFVSLVREASVSWHFALGLIALLFFAIGYTTWPWQHSPRETIRSRAASERCSPPHSSEPAWQKSQHDCLSQRGLCAIIFLQPCRNWAHRIGWKLHGSLSKRGGYDKE